MAQTQMTMWRLSASTSDRLGGEKRATGATATRVQVRTASVARHIGLPGPGRTLRVPEVTPNQRIHDGIPPGPYTRSRSSRRSARNTADIAPTRRMLLQQMELLRSSLSLDTDARYHRSRGRATPPQLAKGFQPGWSHPLPPPPGYSHNIVEPAIDLEGFLAGQEDAVAPLPNTTPICACCERALMLDGANESRIWALPCGHVIDGLCVSRLSGRSLGASEGENVQSSPKDAHAPGKVFKCPVEGCQQRCHPEPGHRHSCIELYI